MAIAPATRERLRLTQALYNRIRPRTFAQVVGQEHVTDALAAALSSGRLHHAYLFSGPRGCGKTSSARILAASLNCVTGPTATPCGTCEHCTAIRAGSSMDVIEIDAASHRGIDDAREIRERAIFTPAAARFKVYIIDEAHQITSDAFNALLKLVEEPPPHLKFVFATTEPDKVLQTIRSRTHHYSFRLVPPAVLRDFLAQVCTDEGVVVEPAVLPLVVRAAAGSVRDSLSVLDQLIAGAGPEGVTAARAAALLGLSDVAVLDAAVEALAAKAPSGAFAVVDQVMATGHDPRRFAMDLLERVRDLLLLQTVPDAPDRGLLSDYAPDQLERMRLQAGRMGASELSRAADLLHAGLVEMRDTMSPRLMFELVLARILLPGASADPAALQVRLERLERQVARGGAGSPATRPAAHAATAPRVDPPPASPPVAVAPEPARPPQAAGTPAQAAAPTPAPEAWPAAPEPSPPTPSVPKSAASEHSLADVVRVWPDLLTAIAARKVPGFRRALALLAQGQPVAVNGTSRAAEPASELVLAFTAANARNFQSSGVGEQLLADALSDHFNGRWKISYVHKSPDNGSIQLPPDATTMTPQSQPSSPTDSARERVQDPVSVAMETLGAQILEERETG